MPNVFNRYLTFYRPGLQMVVFLALLSMSWFTGDFVLGWIQESLLGMNAEALQQMKEIPPHLHTPYKLYEAAALLLLLFLPALLFAYLAYPRPAEYLRLREGVSPGPLLLFLLLLLIALPFSGLLEHWNAGVSAGNGLKELDERYTMVTSAMLSGSRTADLLLNLCVLTLLPAVVEEVFFRGCLQQIMLAWIPRRHWLALLLCAAIFSALHGQMSAFIPRFFLGLLLGVAVYWSGNLWHAIAMHALNNAIMVVLHFLYLKGVLSVDLTNLPDVHLWMGLLSGGLTAGLLYMLWLRRRAWTVLQVSDEPTSIQEQTISNDDHTP